MSDVATLGARLRAIVADLPTGQARRAAVALDEGRAALLHALRDSVEPAGTQQFHQAKDLLDTAVRQLVDAADHLDHYLKSIGLTSAGDIDSSMPVDSSVGSGEVAPGGADWWRQRINLISDGDATTPPQEVTVTKLFSELVDRARNGDRDGYRTRLLAAGPAAGPRLPGLSWPMVRSLTADLLGRTPTTADDGRLRRLVTGPVKALLPKLPDDVVMSQLHGACSIPHPAPDTDRRDGHRAEPEHGGGHHPVDVAAVGPAIVAALLRERPTARRDT